MALTQVNGGMLDSVAQQVGFRNRIINGAMMIDQRNAGASVTPATNQYTLDRWVPVASQTSKITIQQNAGAVTSPAGFSKYLGVTSLSAYSSISTDQFALYQRIEGVNYADFNWGTANAQAISVSFWVRSSLTGLFGVGVTNYYGNSSYFTTYTIAAANTWQYITITIPGATSGDWTGGVPQLQLRFDLGSGSNMNSTANTWLATDSIRTAGCNSIVGTSGATFYITGVQLEKGSTATSFDYRPYGTELALCQRYYWYCNNEQRGFTNEIGRGVLPATGINFRATPSISTGPTTIIESGATVFASPTLWSSITPTGSAWTTTTNGTYPNRGVVFQTLSYSAEL